MRVDLGGEQATDVTVEVLDGKITLKGKNENTESRDGVESHRSFSFMQSFLLPDDVDHKNFRVERDIKKLTVIFKRRQDRSLANQ